MDLGDAAPWFTLKPECGLESVCQVCHTKQWTVSSKSAQLLSLTMGSVLFNPGTILVMCGCKNRVNLGWLILHKHESTRVVCNLVYTRFKKPPRLIVYDNGCT